MNTEEPYKTGKVGLSGLIAKTYCCPNPTCDSNLSPPFTTPLAELKCGNCGKECEECRKEKS